jgi:hypothetical protein
MDHGLYFFNQRDQLQDYGPNFTEHRTKKRNNVLALVDGTG